MSDTNFTPDSDNSFVDPEDVVDELDTDPEVPAHSDGEPQDLDDEARP